MPAAQVGDVLGAHPPHLSRVDAGDGHVARRHRRLAAPQVGARDPVVGRVPPPPRAPRGGPPPRPRRLAPWIPLWTGSIPASAPWACTRSVILARAGMSSSFHSLPSA